MERDRGTLVDPQKMTVAQLLDTYLTHEVPQNVSPENIANYELVIRKHLKPALGSIKVQRLTVQHVEQFHSALRERRYSSSLMKKCHMRLKAALRLGVRWQIVSRNVCESVSPPRLTTKPARVWSPVEAATFLAIARESHDPLTMYWTLMLETGARTSELLGVSWKDVNFDAGTIRLGVKVVRLMGGTTIVKTGGKTESASRTILLTTPTLGLLRDHRTTWVAKKLAAAEWTDEHEFIFVSKTGHPLIFGTCDGPLIVS